MVKHNMLKSRYDERVHRGVGGVVIGYGSVIGLVIRQDYRRTKRRVFTAKKTITTNS